MRPDNRSEHVSIVDFPETRVAAIEHRGDPRTIGDTIRSFIEWRKLNRLPPSASATYNVFVDGPGDATSDVLRMDICAATGCDVAENPFGVVAKTIPGGRCAVLRHLGSDDTLEETVSFLYATWLPASGEEPRDSPLFLHRVAFLPDVPEHEAITDVYLPIM